MCHLLSTICCIKGFSGIVSKTFSEHCNFNNEIYHKQLKMFSSIYTGCITGGCRGQHPIFFERRQQFLNFFVENIIIYYTPAEKHE